MYKCSYIITLKPYIFILVYFILLFPNLAIGSQQSLPHSVITVPIEVDLKILENHLNDLVPNLLAGIEELDKVCVEAQYLKTKGIPKCRRDGYKISCKNQTIKIKTIPQINCDIRGWVKRNGPISLAGKGKTLHFKFPIKAQVSTEAGIEGVANASGILHIYAIPNIDKDWVVSVDIRPHFIWSQQPTVTLLKVLKINIKNKVEPKLRKRIRDFVQKVPKLLADLEIKEKLHTAWKELQEPLKLDDDSEIYLLFKPKSASYSGFNIVDNILKTTISAEGTTEIIIGKPSTDYKKSALCNLGSSNCEEGKFNFHLPISLSYEELLEFSNQKLLHTSSLDLIDNTLPGVLKLSQAKIEKASEGKIRISAHIDYDNRSTWLKMIDFFNWFDIDGEIIFHASPRIDQETRSLVLDNFVYDSTTNSDLFDALIDASEIEPIKEYFATLMRYEFGQKIDDGIIKANKALKKFSKGDMNLSAHLQMASIEKIIINEKHITLYTKLSGKVNMTMGL